MVRIWKLSRLEYKKIIQRPGVYFGILAASALSIGIAYYSTIHPESFGMRHVYSFFASISELMIFFFASKSLGDEFQFKTSTLMFSNSFPREHVLLSKVISICMLGLSLGVISSAIAACVRFLTVDEVLWSSVLYDMGKVCMIYILYAFCVGSFAMMVAANIFSAPVTLVFCVVGYWLGSTILGLMAQNFQELQWLIRLLPFYTASGALMFHTLEGLEIIGLIAGGLVFTAMGSLTLARKDIA